MEVILSVHSISLSSYPSPIPDFFIFTILSLGQLPSDRSGSIGYHIKRAAFASRLRHDHSSETVQSLQPQDAHQDAWATPTKAFH